LTLRRFFVFGRRHRMAGNGRREVQVFRLSDRERAQVTEGAAAVALTFSEFVRESALQAAKRAVRSARRQAKMPALEAVAAAQEGERDG
jgi:uncharacterized protein (DUF1778 family)